MDQQLPEEFDLIVVGTGFVESVVSAAASRIGKRVLQLDSSSYYGGLWASFGLDSIQKIKDEDTPQGDSKTDLVKDGEDLIQFKDDVTNLKDFSCHWHIPEKVEGFDATENKPDCSENKKDESTEKPAVFSQESLMKDSRKFNLDLMPKLQYARGEFVELLISSNIARYSEFRSVSRVLTWINGKLDVVPCSRSDVFANNNVSVIEKRVLMKVLTDIDIDEEDKRLCEVTDRTFKDILKERKLSDSLIHYVLYALARSTDDTSCADGITQTKRFLSSLGRFGKTPFLFSMYGSGEIPQAFCRLSAVFGAIFALGQALPGFTLSNDKFTSLLCGKQRISAANIVMNVEKWPRTLKDDSARKYISRAIFITDKSLMDSEREHLTLLLYPPENGKNLLTILELGTLTGACPKGTYIVHVISKQVTQPREDFKHCVANLFELAEGDSDRRKPKILWSCYFSVPDTNDIDLKDNVPSNILLCPGPDYDLDYDYSVKKAKDLFDRLYPDSEFLPRAPDADEIIIGDDDDAVEKAESSEQNEEN